MPLTSIQKEVLRHLAAGRTPASHIAGGAVINRAPGSPRFSADLDVFHDQAELVAACAQADAALLSRQGFALDWLTQQPFLRRARICKGNEELRLDWGVDSPFRFFPVQADAEFGYCLHPADLATNKILALAGRSEIRDFVDILYLHETYLGLGAMSWAACGKDQGFTPWSLLEFARRHLRFRDEELAGERTSRPLRLVDLKESWMKAVDQAEAWFGQLPAADLGCLYLDKSLQPFMPDPRAADFAEVIRHFGSVGGSWPTSARK